MTRPEIPSLTGLRFWAAMLVVLAHLTALHLIRPGFASLGNLTVLGNLGMTLFFVLSGFVIHYNYGERLSELRAAAIYEFAVARFARLYPLFFLATVLHIAVWPSAPTAFASAIPFYLTLTHDWFPIVYPPDGRMLSDVFTPGSWSISLEVLLYILYLPLAFVMPRIVRNERHALAAVLIICIPVTAFHLYRAATLWGINDIWLWYRSPAGRFPEFLLGVLIAQLYLWQMNAKTSAFEFRATLTALGISAALFVSASAGYFYYPPKPWSVLLLHCWTFAPFCGALIYALARFRWAWAISMFESRFALLLGDASYSVYLLHPPILWAFAWQGTQASWFIAVKIAVSLAAVCTIGVWCFLHIEAPARRLIRKSMSRSQATAGHGPRN